MDKLIGFRLKDAMEYLRKMEINEYIFEVTKEPRMDSIPIDENFRVLRVIKKGEGTVRILVCEDS